MFFEDRLADTSDSESSLKEVVNNGDGEHRSIEVPHRHPPSLPESSAQLPSRLGSVSSPIADEGNAPKVSASFVSSLVQATENERHCPDILLYPAALIDTAVGLIAHQQERVRQLSEAEKQASALESPDSMSLLPFKPSDIMSLELQRLQFFLCELLRCRLRKIEAMCMSIYYEGLLEGGAPPPEVEIRSPQRGFLSHNERVVADRLAVASRQAALQAGLAGAPEPLQHLVPHPPDGEGGEVLPEPDLNTYVFGLALVDLGVVRVGEYAEQSIQSGDLFLMPYWTFRPYVRAGQVRLV
ncbi:unnamed protein product [Phytomonas sp. EM1]|nr:unnamed protein product [Phytomonas sp. EM1]|eukprot:CCW59719.1 unnamed protein product [Phytomonas sp. isolate EM1]